MFLSTLHRQNESNLFMISFPLISCLLTKQWSRVQCENGIKL